LLPVIEGHRLSLLAQICEVGVCGPLVVDDGADLRALLIGP
jgi:hypothetical protein